MTKTQILVFFVVLVGAFGMLMLQRREPPAPPGSCADQIARCEDREGRPDIDHRFVCVKSVELQ